MGSSQGEFHAGLHRLALFLACFTPVLLLAGALVTSTGSSLSVPDWPLSFGTFFPRMEGGVLFEHGHRLIAGTVVCLTLGIAFYAQRVEPRVWVRGLAWAALGAVLLQAILGGVTVLWHLPTQVSVAHAGLAQIFFCLAVSLALVTSPGWIRERPGRLPASPLPKVAAAVTGLVYLQIVVGAVTRHSGAGLAIPDFPLSFGQILPPEWTSPVLLQFLHTRLGASAVLVSVSLLAYRVCRKYPEESLLFWPAASAALLVWVQCFLGFGVLLTRKAILPTSLHVVVGAGVLGSTLVLTLKSHQLFKKGEAR